MLLSAACGSRGSASRGVQDLVLQSGQGEIQVAQLEGAVKQIAAFAQARSEFSFPHFPNF